MAIYEIQFSMNGITHKCTGQSSYPTKEIYESGDCIDHILQNNIRQFITLYKKENGFNENTPYNITKYTIYFEK